jgi:hypothetical protein
MRRVREQLETPSGCHRFLYVSRTMPSLREYILVAQDAPRIEQWIRQPDDNWLRSETSGRDANIQLASVDCVLPLAEVYDKIEWPAAGRAQITS